MPKGIGLTGTKAGILDGRDFEVARQSELFADIAPGLLELVLPRTRMIRLDHGEVLIERGTANEFVYLVLEGGLDVYLDDGSTPACFALGIGACAGEISVIDGGVASARVVAVGPTRVLSIDGRMLWYLIANTDAAARNLLLIFSGRMRRDNDLLLGKLRERQNFERIASVDGLTGLHNRRWMDALFTRQMVRCARNGGRVCLLLVDVDRFREFNLRFGQLKGDRALQQIAVVLPRCMRPSDLLARVDGDRFAILLPDTGLEQACGVAGRVRAAINDEAITVRDAEPAAEPLTVSVGLAEMHSGDTLGELCSAAETGLESAIANGGDCACSQSGEPA
jgi:diguanylate cyclase (GGDEF)-like protein